MDIIVGGKGEEDTMATYQLNDRNQTVFSELRRSDGLCFLLHWKSSALNTAIADKGRKSNEV